MSWVFRANEVEEAKNRADIKAHAAAIVFLFLIALSFFLFLPEGQNPHLNEKYEKTPSKVSSRSDRRGK
jgi:hypothetical protein